MMPSSDPRRTRAYRAARAVLLRHKPQPCTICGKPIDYDAPPRTPPSPSADHVAAVILGGAGIDLSNLRPTHYGCNARRGAILGNLRRRGPVADPGPSRAW